MFGGIIGESAYHAYSYTTTICSIIANSLLIFVLLFTKLNNVGAYRWLLFCFATVDILVSLIHTWMFPAAHMTEFGYIFWGYRFLDKSTSFGVYGSLCWCFLFYQSFILLAFHYVYRYVILFNPPWLSWMYRNPWRNWVTLGIFLDVLYAGSIVAVVGAGWQPTEESRRVFAPILMETYGIDLLSENMPGFLHMTYWIPQQDGSRKWTWLPVVTMLMAVFVIFTAVVVIFLCIIKVLAEMKTAKWQQLQSNTKRMQRQLTIIPTFVCYIPVAVTLFAPLVSEVALGGLATVGLMSMELFPIIDPLLIIFFVTGFPIPLPAFLRRAVLGPEATPAGVSEMTTSVQDAPRVGAAKGQRMPT